MIPREDLVEGSAAVGVEGGINAAFIKYIQPFLQREAVAPAVKAHPALMGEEHRLIESAVAAGKYRLEERGIGIVIIVGDFGEADLL